MNVYEFDAKDPEKLISDMTERGYKARAQPDKRVFIWSESEQKLVKDLNECFNPYLIEEELGILYRVIP
jgi:hypothetical protein